MGFFELIELMMTTATTGDENKTASKQNRD
jgi:hypothetical protein